MQQFKIIALHHENHYSQTIDFIEIVMWDTFIFEPTHRLKLNFGSYFQHKYVFKKIIFSTINNKHLTLSTWPDKTVYLTYLLLETIFCLFTWKISRLQALKTNVFNKKNSFWITKSQRTMNLTRLNGSNCSNINRSIAF